MHDLFQSSFKTLSFCTWHLILCTFYWHALRDHICSLGSLYSKIPLREQKRSVHIGHIEVAGETGLRGLSKCIVGLSVGDEKPPCWQCVPQNSPTMHFENHLDPVSRATSKWPHAHRPVLTWRTTEIWKKKYFFVSWKSIFIFKSGWMMHFSHYITVFVSVFSWSLYYCIILMTSLAFFPVNTVPYRRH